MVYLTDRCSDCGIPFTTKRYFTATLYSPIRCIDCLILTELKKDFVPLDTTPTSVLE